MEMSLFRLLFYGIPENIALVALAFAIAKARFDWKKIGIIGAFLACAAFLIRLIPITFGVHTIVAIGLLIFLLCYNVKVDLTRSIISVLITYFTVILVEAGSRTTTLSIFALSMEEVMKSELLIIITGIPEVIILFLIAFIVKKYILKDID